MLRAEIELNMKKNGLKNIDLIYHKEDKIGKHCFLQGGYLMDHTAHRVDRKLDIWGYIEWLGGGNADRVGFNGERIPMMRGGVICANV